MKGLSKLSYVCFALFLAAACGDDDDSTQTEPKCQVPYGDRTAATLKAATTTGACVEDTATVCNNNMVMIASECGVSCNAKGGDIATIGACTQECIQTNASPKPSDGCTTCYVQDVGCSIQKCLNECISGANAACNACRAEQGCTAAFYACSGLPAPTTGNGGNGGNGGNTGGSGNATGGAPGAGSGGDINGTGGDIGASGGSGGDIGATGGVGNGTSGAGGDVAATGGSGGAGGAQ
jgi:hypothetical protein